MRRGSVNNRRMMLGITGGNEGGGLTLWMNRDQWRGLKEKIVAIHSLLVKHTQKS